MQINHSIIVEGSLASTPYRRPIADSMAALHSIAYDLQKVSQLCTALAVMLEDDSDLNPMILESHTFHILTRYARCFGSSGGRTVSLDDSQVKRLRRPDLLQLHIGIIDRRDRTFAHAGKLLSSFLVAHLVRHDGEYEAVLAQHEETAGPIIDPEQARLIGELCEGLLGVVEEMAMKKSPHLDQQVTKDLSELIAELIEGHGKHYSPEQTALTILQRFVREQAIS